MNFGEKSLEEPGLFGGGWGGGRDARKQSNKTNTKAAGTSF